MTASDLAGQSLKSADLASRISPIPIYIVHRNTDEAKFVQLTAVHLFDQSSNEVLYRKGDEKANFQDLTLDSLNRVELIMAFELEFSIEISDAKADQLACCADVVKYILSETQSSNSAQAF